MHILVSKALFSAQTSGINDQLNRIRRWQSYKIEHPILDIGFTASTKEGQRIRMLCENWDDEPPSIQILSLNGDLLQAIKTDPAGVFNNSRHPSTGLPFICMRGSREYHTHPSHINDPWSNYRGKSGYDLGGILTQIWRASLKISS